MLGNFVACLGVKSLFTLSGQQHLGLTAIDGEDVIVALDGRLDNAETLRRELNLSPTTPPSEIVARGYAQRSEALFDCLTGDFALLIWDHRRNVFFAVRDALGTRPLYYWQDGPALLVASDVEAFLNCREFDRAPDGDAIVDYLLGTFRSPERTFFSQAHRIPGGHYLARRPTDFRISRYWYPPRQEVDSLTTAECYDRFRQLFEQAVRRRLVARSPVLVHVSGGLDSTSILSAAKLSSESGEVEGIAAVHPGLSCDESEHIADVGTALSVSVETWNGMQSEPLDLISPCLVAPGARAVMSGGSTGDLEIARRKGAKVILSGTGGDQLGTPTGVLQQMFRNRAWMEALHWTLGFPGASLKERVHRLAYGLWGLAPAQARELWSRRIPRRPEWLDSGIRMSVGDSVYHSRDLTFLSIIQRRHWEELTSAGLEMSVDSIQRQASEANLEVRFPFLDRDLVAFVLAIPLQFWPEPDGRERLHRQALAAILPPKTVARRSKAEFSDVLTHRVRMAHYTIQDLLLGPTWASEAYVNQAQAIDLLHRVLTGGAHPLDGIAMWRIATVEAWLRAVFGYPNGSGEHHADRGS